MLGALTPGTKGPVNRLANRKHSKYFCAPQMTLLILPSAYWVEIDIESSFFPYTLPMSIAGAVIFLFAVVAPVYVDATVLVLVHMK